MAKRRKRRNAPLRGVRQLGANMTEVGHGDLTILYSYKTPVALLAPAGGYRTSKKWSVTTSKHIGKFFERHGYDARGAAKIPQEDIEAFAREGKAAGAAGMTGAEFAEQHFPINLDPTPAEKRDVVERLTRRRNPEEQHAAFGSGIHRNTGLFIDGSFGIDHAIQVMVGLLQRVNRVGGAGANELLEAYDDDDIDEEFQQEWLDDATDVLNDNTAGGLVWEWDAGDLILREAED